MAKGLVSSSEITVEADTDRVWLALTDPEQIKVYLYGTEAVSDWQELGQSSSVRILQQFNWVGTISSTNPLGMGSSRHAFAQCFSRGHPFLGRRTEKLRVLAHNVFDLGSSYLHVFQFIALRMMSLAV